MSNAAAAFGAVGTLTVYPESNAPVFVGSGFNTITRSVMADAVSEDNPRSMRGQEVLYQLKQVETTSQLRELLEVNAAASFSGIFGGSVSARTKFATQHNLSRYSFYLLVHVKVTNAPEGNTSFSLKQEAANYVRENYADEDFQRSFFNKWGDTFVIVTGITTGGELIGMIEIETETEEQSRQVQVQIKAAVKQFEFDGDLKSALNSMGTTATTQFTYIRTGGEGPVTGMANLIAEAQGFPDAVKKAPKLVSFTVQGYNTAFPPGKQGPSASKAEKALRTLAELQDRLNGSLSDLSYIERCPTRFVESIQAKIPGLRDQIKGIRTRMGDAAGACKEDPLKDAGNFDDLEQSVKAIEKEIPPRPMGMPAIILQTHWVAGGSRTPPSQGHQPEATLQFGDDLKIISGGARVVYSNNWDKSIRDLDGGAFLTACYPDGVHKWYVRAKDHWQDFPGAAILAWAIVIRDPRNLWEVDIQKASSSSSTDNEVTARLRPGFSLTGGGAFADFRGGGNLLTASYPSSNTSWTARSRSDWRAQDACVLTAYAIGIRPASKAAPPPVKITTAEARGERPTATAVTENGYTIVGGGISTEGTGAGHWLIESYHPPATFNGWTTSSKWHFDQANVTLRAYAIGMESTNIRWEG